MIRDITLSQRSEQAPRTDDRRLRLAEEATRETLRRQRELAEMKESFLTAISHELRTPLTSLLGFADTLRAHDDKLSPERRREYLNRLIVNAERLERLLMDLLDVDRLSRGILEPQRRPLDLGPLVGHVVDRLRLRRTRPVQTHLESVVAPVDPGWTERIVESLLDNVVKHTPSGTPVQVAVFSTGSEAVIEIADEGPGVPKGLREAVFDPFSQGPTAPVHAPGVGIGLSLAARLARMQGGTLALDDGGGPGATFCVLLPLAAPSQTPRPYSLGGLGE